MNRRLQEPVAALAVAAASAAAVTLSLAVTASPASAVTCQADVPVIGDVDGDGLADLAVGLPSSNRSTGAVDLRLTTAPSRLLTRSAAGLGVGAPGDAFGRSVGLDDFDSDGCAEVVVGAPGAASKAGRVLVVRGGPTGFVITGERTLTGGSVAGDGFGSAVAVSSSWPRDGFDLWVGAPGDDVDGAVDAGSVTHYAVTAAGGVLSFFDLGKITQDTPGVPGIAEPGDRFGSVLSASRFGVLVGQPAEDVGASSDAGAVTYLLNSGGPAPFERALSWSQASPGVPGAAEAGDRFGAAVSALGRVAIAGVPGEDVGHVADAGMVQTFLVGGPFDGPVVVNPTRALDQNSPGVPGVVEAGDRFGAAVTLGRNMACLDEDTVDAAIGVPLEDLTVAGRTVRDAGAVTVVTVGGVPHDPCPALSVDQNTVLSGIPEAGDHLGATLSLGRHRDDAEEDELSDRAFIGVPGEDVGTVVDAGTVQSTAHGTGLGATSITVAGRQRQSVGNSGGSRAGLGYGRTLASPAGDAGD